MIQFINCTPHRVVLETELGERVTLSPSGNILGLGTDPDSQPLRDEAGFVTRITRLIA